MSEDSSNWCLLLCLLILLLPVASLLGLFPKPETFNETFNLVIVVLVLFSGFLLLVGFYRSCNRFENIDEADKKRWPTESKQLIK